MAVLVRFAVDRSWANSLVRGSPTTEVNLKVVSDADWKDERKRMHLIEVIPGKLPGTLELKVDVPARPTGTSRRKSALPTDAEART